MTALLQLTASEARARRREARDRLRAARSDLATALRDSRSAIGRLSAANVGVELISITLSELVELCATESRELNNDMMTHRTRIQAALTELYATMRAARLLLETVGE